MAALQTTNAIITITGKVFYNDQRRRIDLKRPIKDLIPEGTVHYVMELCFSADRAATRIDQLAKNGTMPILLHFVTTGGDHDDLP